MLALSNFTMIDILPHYDMWMLGSNMSTWAPNCNYLLNYSVIITVWCSTNASWNKIRMFSLLYAVPVQRLKQDRSIQNYCYEHDTIPFNRPMALAIDYHINSKADNTPDISLNRIRRHGPKQNDVKEHILMTSLTLNLTIIQNRPD